MKSTKLILTASVLSAFILTGCQSNADSYAADVYDVHQLNTRQNTKTIRIISVEPAKVAVDNSSNQRSAQTVGAILGAVAGGVVGHNVGTGSGIGTTAGAVAGGTLGAVTGSAIKDKNIVEAVTLTYQEAGKVYSSTQVGQACQFRPGEALVIMTKNNETRIQPNAVCVK